jgi:zinc transport system substrate-binding protein
MLLLAAGCGRTRAKTHEKLSVSATVYPLADLVRQVGGSYVDVSWVIESGQSLDGSGIDPELRNTLRNANLIVLNGVTEPWADEGARNPYAHERMLRLDNLEAAAKSGSRPGAYLWLDPAVMRNAAIELGERILIQRPEYQKQVRAQAQAFAQKLDELTDEYRAKFKKAQTRRILVLGPEFDGILNRFGFVIVPTVDASPMRLSEDDLRTIKRLANENDTHLLMVSADIPSATARDLELRGGFQIVRIDCLGSSGSGGKNSYVQLMRFDLEQLLNATTVR